METSQKYHRMTSKYAPSFESLGFELYDKNARHLSPDESDSRFWSYMKKRKETEAIMYPSANGSFMNPYKMLWNLSHFPSLINAISDNGHIFDGLTLPYTYLGMLHSIFACHVEDLKMFSLNYLHWGAPKTWISVAVPYALKFEKLHQLLFKTVCENPLSHKTSVIDPSILELFGIKHMIVSQ